MSMCPGPPGTVTSGRSGPHFTEGNRRRNRYRTNDDVTNEKDWCAVKIMLWRTCSEKPGRRDDAPKLRQSLVIIRSVVVAGIRFWVFCPSESKSASIEKQSTNLECAFKIASSHCY